LRRGIGLLRGFVVSIPNGRRGFTTESQRKAKDREE